MKLENRFTDPPHTDPPHTDPPHTHAREAAR